MLKALELVGFKSFADKTRFEFPEGITVVVGPNGSGKSNIVDAMKWVLGEQSAKSLRGKDMSDVIFKGSGAGGRRPVNTAEATIVFDNSDKRLAIEAPEVHVTRRVFRSGEGEYLINREPCRLKDIRDLFRGTGVGADAYSLIEQGKVDQLLQASPRDRRAIFEEAAGISRFKAKKIEAQRRLERVDQNLLRLSDIVDEVDSRLRSVRAQAAKARRYKDYSDRLQQLRTQVGLNDWRKLTRRLEGIEAELEQLRNQAALAQAEIESVEAHALESEVQLSETGEAIRSCEASAAHNRERIAQCEATIGHQRNRSRELEEEETRLRQQLAALNNRAGDLNHRLHETATSLQDAETEYREIESRLTQHERVLRDLDARLDQLRVENETKRHEFVDLTRQAASLGNQVESCQSRMTSAQQTAAHCETRLAELTTECESHASQLEQQQTLHQRLVEEAESDSATLEAAQAELAESRQRLSRRRDELTQLQQRYSGSHERAVVLEELEKNLEGVSAGVKEVLAKSQQEEPHAFAEVRGLVANLVQAGFETAPLVDVALGENAQHVVVVGEGPIELLQSGAYRPAGRVGFIRLDAIAAMSRQQIDLEGRPGVVGRIDRLVNFESQYAGLIRHLLGCTWLMEDLASALQLAKSAGPGQRFVTLAGQLLEADGTLIVGPKPSATGLVSRRSELRALQSELGELESQIADLQQQVDHLHQDINRRENEVRRLSKRQQQAVAALTDARVRTRELQQEHQQLEKQCETHRAELQAALAQQQSASEELDQTSEQLVGIEVLLTEVETEIQSTGSHCQQIEKQRQQHSQQATAAKVQLATSRQQLESLQTAMSRFEEDQRERSRSILEVGSHLSACTGRRQQSEQNILRATSEVAELYLHKESFAEESEGLVQRQDELNQQRTSLSEESQKHRKILRKNEDQQHQKELAAGEIRHQRDALSERMREDYGIELAELTHDPTAEEQRQREEVEEEIASLRRKINNIGAVNLDALAELEELEARHGSLSTQFQDLTQAKDALERIIEKINADSRRLFVETLEAIRKNFQVLYRRAFGGGRADLVLEEGVDVLESGVEILTTPPGKPQFSNSLLSGGEKALTAVSLLLAIFEYRPSPFCILDEVDAPFDEANIGRFIDVLKEFLGWTKFVIVTHSKKTMTAATTLYGITMQESGVSKRVSVKFEDVSEDGHISQDAIQRDETGKDDDERGAA